MTNNSNTLFAERRGAGFLLPFVLVGTLVAVGIGLAVSFSLGVEAGPNAAGYSAPALFNQANTEARAEKTGEAVVDYERAKLLAPGDAAIAANLQAVRDRAGLPSTAPNRLDRFIERASPNAWAMAGSAGLVLAGAGLLMTRTFPRIRPVGTLAVMAGTVLLALCGTSAFVSWQTAQTAVVIAKSAPGRISPTTVGEVAFKLREGEVAPISGSYGDFVLLRDAAGQSGWVSRKDVTTVIPD